MSPDKIRSEEEIISTWKGDIQKPIVSIRCSTFNHFLYIEDAIKSFLNQETDFPFEIWIHDDASTDGTDKIVKHYCDLYPRIVKAICQTENQYSQGVRVGALLNKYCKGQYIALCEGDDYWIGRHKLSNQLNAMKRNPDVDLCVHPGIMLDVKNNISYKKFWHGDKEKIIGVEYIASSLQQFSPTASYLFKKKSYEAMPDWYLNGRNTPFGDYFVETILGKNGVLYIPQYSCVYRRNVAGSYTVRTQKAQASELTKRLAAVVKYTNMLNEIPEIPSEAIIKRLEVVHYDYLNMAVSRRAYFMARSVIDSAKKELGENGFVDGWKWKNRWVFNIYSLMVNSYRDFKKIVKDFVPKKQESNHDILSSQ